MAVGMSPVHWQLAGSSALAHHSIPIPVSVPRGRDHGLRIPPASAPAALHSLLPRGFRLLARPLDGVLRLFPRHFARGDFLLRRMSGFWRDSRPSRLSHLGNFELTGADVISIGSVVPVAGTIAGGILGAGAGFLAGNAIGGAFGPKKLRFEHEGEMDILHIARIRKDGEGCLTPAKYRLEVESQSAWLCRFIQPDLDQSFGPLVEEDGDDYKDAIPSVDCLIGPRTSGTRPLLANIRHRCGGRFHAAPYSVDGPHECVLYEQKEGQFHVENYQTVQAGEFACFGGVVVHLGIIPGRFTRRGSNSP